MAAEKKQRIYTFSKGDGSKGTKDMKELLGGKGANLCEMARLGLNVPPGFVIATTECRETIAAGNITDELWSEIEASISVLEKVTGKRFGDASDPLLVSIRSGAALSMPGMMNTVLSVGLDGGDLGGLEKKGGRRFALDCNRRLLDMYGDVVLNIPHSRFERELQRVKDAAGAKQDVDLTAEHLEEVVKSYEAIYKERNFVLPYNGREALRSAVAAVFRSWETPRAKKYREINRITGLIGTACNIQAMVFGNLNDRSATGVCFTRSPATGEKKLFGEFLVNAQGEDVVAGIRTPLPIDDLASSFPKAHAELVASTQALENHMRDVQDCEFTIEDDVLYMLQTRNGKRTGTAALEIALALEGEGLVSRDEAVMMVEPRHLDQLLHPLIKDGGRAAERQGRVVGRGLAASPGAAVGTAVFSAEAAEAAAKAGKSVILVRKETSPEDVGGMHAAAGILTARGGLSSHAAVVARGWGKPCVCGVGELSVDEKARTASVGGWSFGEDDPLTLDGTAGIVIRGAEELAAPSVTAEPGGGKSKLAILMGWADERRKLGVRANADTPEDAAVARANGAEGIGLVRTEHMFFASAERIKAMRTLIGAAELAREEGEGGGNGEEEEDDEDAKKKKAVAAAARASAAASALAALKNYQRDDFAGIFRAMKGLPVVIRCLDPPLHEFLPAEGPALDELVASLSGLLQISREAVYKKIKALHEANPMLGFRGCRLGIVHPSITRMQAQAILEAAALVAREQQGEDPSLPPPKPKIMIPLVGFAAELREQVRVVREAAEDVFRAGDESGLPRVSYEVGTMIELPRAALAAGELAAPGLAQFFSVGSNDLTQTTLGFSRDDAEARFLPVYLKEGIIPADPFATIDKEGVGELIKMACERGRAAATKKQGGSNGASSSSSFECGVCGEHGGDAASIAFFDSIGIDYVSCSPLRVPLARLAAAQAAIKMRSKGGDHCQD